MWLLWSKELHGWRADLINFGCCVVSEGKINSFLAINFYPKPCVASFRSPLCFSLTGVLWMFAASPPLVVVLLWVYFTALSRQRSSHKTNASSGEGRVQRLLLIGGKCSAYGACVSAAAEVVKRCSIFPCCCGATGGAMAARSPYILAVYPLPPKNWYIIFHDTHRTFPQLFSQSLHF